MTKIEISGKSIPLKYTLSAMAEMEETLGKVGDVVEMLKGKRRVRVLACLLAIFARAAGENITADWVMQNLSPARFMEAYILVMDAYSEGMRTEQDVNEGKAIDLGLQEIEKKRGKGGLTWRLMTALGLQAGVSYTESQKLTPGVIFDLFLHRRKYDDAQHGIRRE